MPQVLAETPSSAAIALGVNGRAVHSSHEQITSILRSRLGANHADLLAAPKPQADGTIRWITALNGAALRASELPDDARQKLLQRRERIAGEILGLAAQFKAEASQASGLVAQTLELALAQPEGDWLFSVDSKPVMVLWGHSTTGAPLPAAAAPAVPLAPKTATPAASAPAPLTVEPFPSGAEAASAGAASLAAPAASGGDWRRMLPWLLLALIAIAAAWGLTRCTPAAANGLDQQIAEAEAQNKALEAQLAGRPQARMQCVPDAPPPAASAPEVPPSAPEPQASAPMPAPASSPEPKASEPPPKPPANPLDELKKRISAAGDNCDKLATLLQKEPLLQAGKGEATELRMGMMQTMQKNCREKAIAAARNACPGQRPPELAPEMALVFDASGSMKINVNLTPEQLAEVKELERQLGTYTQNDAARDMLGVLLGQGAQTARAKQQQLAQLEQRLNTEPSRVSVAKRASLDIVRRLPSDMNVGLVMVDQCPAARPIDMYAPARRQELLDRIQGINANQGTPLGDGIAKAGQMLDGVNREAMILVVSDGEESCSKQSPCDVAAALKQAKPHIKINVVDITGTGAGNCLAEATGGRVFTANNADEVLAMSKRAAQEAMGPENCKR